MDLTINTSTILLVATIVGSALGVLWGVKKALGQISPDMSTTLDPNTPDVDYDFHGIDEPTVSRDHRYHEDIHMDKSLSFN